MRKKVTPVKVVFRKTEKNPKRWRNHETHTEKRTME